MKKILVKLLSSAALAAFAAATASAATIHGNSFDLSYDENSITAVSYTGNTFTFTAPRPVVAEGYGYLTIREYFRAEAHAGVQFTGDVDIRTKISYQTQAMPWTSGPYSANLNSIVDVLAPNCATCSMYDAKLLGQGSALANGASSPNPASGTAHGAVDITNTLGGTYDRLALYVINDYTIEKNYGMINIDTFTVTFDTVGGPISSPVPELPPFAMMGAGLAALGLRARFKGRNTQGKAALAA